MPLSAANCAVVVGDSRHHHPLICSHKRCSSESEEGRSEDYARQEGIFILDEAEENEPEPPTQRDSQTAPRLAPAPVSDPSMECAMAGNSPDVTYHYPMTDIITTGGSYVIGTITNESRGLNIQTRMILDQGNHVNPSIVVSEEFFRQLGLEYAERTRLRLRTASEGSYYQPSVGQKLLPRMKGITSQFMCQMAVAQGLSEDINLGSGFLQRVSTVGMDAQLHFHSDGVSLQIEDEIVQLRGEGTTERVERVHPWHERDLIRLPVVREEAEVVEVEGEDLSQGVQEEGMEIQPHLGDLWAVQPKQQHVGEDEIIQVEPERGEQSKERGLEVANVVVVPCDTTSPEEVIAIMVDQVEPQERGLGATRWPEDMPEPARTSEMSHISQRWARLASPALSLRSEH